MSRVGKMPITVPQGVDVSVNAEQISVKGAQGTLIRKGSPLVTVKIDAGKVSFTAANDSTEADAMSGTMRALVANMVTGVTEGFARELEVHGVGYRSEGLGKTLKLAVGFSHPVELAVPEGLSVSLREGKVRIEGIDRQLVGEFAAKVRSVRPPEPYKGKGIRYAGERVRRKVGKAGTA